MWSTSTCPRHPSSLDWRGNEFQPSTPSLTPNRCRGRANCCHPAPGSASWPKWGGRSNEAKVYSPHIESFSTLTGGEDQDWGLVWPAQPARGHGLAMSSNMSPYFSEKRSTERLVKRLGPPAQDLFMAPCLSLDFLEWEAFRSDSIRQGERELGNQ